jgi:hypothetical protein
MQRFFGEATKRRGPGFLVRQRDPVTRRQAMATLIQAADLMDQMGLYAEAHSATGAARIAMSWDGDTQADIVEYLKAHGIPNPSMLSLCEQKAWFDAMTSPRHPPRNFPQEPMPEIPKPLDALAEAKRLA